MKGIFSKAGKMKKPAKPGDLIQAAHMMAKKQSMKKKYKKMSMKEYEKMDKIVDKKVGVKEGSARDLRADKMSKKILAIKGLMKKKPMKKSSKMCKKYKMSSMNYIKDAVKRVKENFSTKTTRINKVCKSDKKGAYMRMETKIPGGVKVQFYKRGDSKKYMGL